MTVYDCRKVNPEPGSIRFPVPVRIIDPQTGQAFPDTVFYLATSPAKIIRFARGPDGEPLVAPVRKKRWVDNGRGGQKLEIYYDRLEVAEMRPWIALRLNKDGTTGEVIDKSEGCS
jgi:hypothetical protein